MILRALTYIVYLLTANAAFAMMDTTFVAYDSLAQLVQIRNYDVLAGRLGVEATRSEARQLAVLDNPQLSVESPVYTGGVDKWFNAGAQGQYALSIDQQINLSGQRSVVSRAATVAADARNAELQRMMQTKIFEAQKAYITLFYALESFKLLTSQLRLFEELLTGFSEQLNKGNVSLREVLRLKATYYAVNDHRSDVHSVLLEARQALQNSIGSASIVLPTAMLKIADRTDSLARLPSEDLIAIALKNRYDAIAAAYSVEQALQFLDSEERKRIPDPVVGLSYDRAGSYASDYVALNVMIPLPIVNTNASGVQAAKQRIEEARLREAQSQNEIRNEVITALERFAIIEAEAEKMDSQYFTQSDEVTLGVIDNYRKGNMSMLEFVDFFETYNETIIRANSLYANRIIAKEYIRNVVGK
jgi:outer membrane protein, heavy metal efflux system